MGVSEQVDIRLVFIDVSRSAVSACEQEGITPVFSIMFLRRRRLLTTCCQ